MAETAAPADALEERGGRRTVQPRSVRALLDCGDNVLAFDGVEEEDPGPMGKYRKGVFARLSGECSLRAAGAPRDSLWLLAMLWATGAEWWLRTWHAPEICEKLGLTYGEPAFEVDPASREPGSTAFEPAS